MPNKALEASTLERVPATEYSDEVKAALATVKENKTADNLAALGMAFSRCGCYREATEAYSEAIALEPFKGILYRYRGHRFLSCYRFNDGLADLTMATRLIPDNWDSWYHLGLARFLTRDFKGAADAYRVCLAMSKTDDEVIAVSDWYWMTAKRLGDDALAEKILSGITDGMEYGDNLDYYVRLQMYQGKIKPEDLLPEDLASASDLSVITKGFGLANYYNILGNSEKANEIMDLVLERGENTMYMAFAYLAILADRGLVQNY